MIPTWRNEMATGVEEIDNQHRDLLRRVEELLSACRERRMQEEVARLLWFLKRYVRKHFRDEEKLQLATGFPGYPAHKAQHEDFFRQVKRLEARYDREGGSTALIVESVHLMCNWLDTHFNTMDALLAEHLRNIGKSPDSD